MKEPRRASRRLFQTAALFTGLAVVMGSVVCATDSGFECSTWPGCYPDRLAPSQNDVIALLYRNPIIEFVHRFSAIMSGPLVLVAALVAMRLRSAGNLVKLLPWVAVAGAIAAGAFGRATVLGGIPTWAAAIDLFCALAAMGAMAVATVALERDPARWRPNRAGRLAWLSVALLVPMHLLGVLVAGSGSYTRCMSWPVWELVAADHSPAGQVVRMVLAVGALGAIAGSAAAARRDASLRGNAVASVVLLVAVLALGLVIMTTQQITGWGMLYSIATVGLLFSQVLLGARASLQPAPVADEAPSRERVTV
ncbi:COX15/CtaA family protein [Nigerium massiliense]|uniref:COX15/CtaA family protein n=1 Tax=Nigerium massiliense TaxID=1522317 RepID=UPI0006944F37|nr:COX15/CtaA family protein [Nigerium massiliense]